MIIFTLTFMILFYGGVNYHKQIEYNSSYFDNYNRITFYKKKIVKYNIPSNYNNDNFIDLSKFEKISDSLIPNLYSIYFINIKPNTIFNINKIFSENLPIVSYSNYLMIIYNFNDHDNLELLINIENFSEIQQNLSETLEFVETKFQKNFQVGDFYKLNKSVTITNIYSIYNFNVQTISNLCIFFVKKPFWYY